MRILHHPPQHARKEDRAVAWTYSCAIRGKRGSTIQPRILIYYFFSKKGPFNRENSPNASQKKMAPAFFVAHHPGSPFVKLSPSALACGSFFAFLQPASVQAEIVVIKLWRVQRLVIQSAGHDVREEEGEGCARSYQHKICSFLLQRACYTRQLVVFFIE